MQPIQRLNTSGRARLLFTLLPDELPGYIEHSYSFVQLNNQQRYGQTEEVHIPEALLLSWFLLIQKAQTLLVNDAYSLSRSPRRVARRLFNPELAVFATTSLNDFAFRRRMVNPKFFKCVRLLFEGVSS